LFIEHYFNALKYKTFFLRAKCGVWFVICNIGDLSVHYCKESTMNTCVTVASVADLSLPDDAVRVAFASMEGDIVDQHFGSAQAFYLYAITANSAELVSMQDFGYEKKDGNEDKLKPKMTWLVGADIVYCGSIGGSATRQLLALGITPQQVSGGPDVDELVADLQQQLQGEPQAWLARVLRERSRNKAESRFDDMDDEGWQE
jgi:nitrogen fixation protein NifX